MRNKPQAVWALVVAIILIILVVGLITPFFANAYRPPASERYAKHWLGRLQTCKSLDDIRAAQKEDNSGSSYVREFKDGSWLAIWSHCSHQSGSEWDMSLFFDSKGNSHVSMHHFCGDEALKHEVEQIQATGVDEFYRSAKDLELRSRGN